MVSQLALIYKIIKTVEVLLKQVENTNTEIIFLVEYDPEGGYTARALSESIFTQAEDLVMLKKNGTGRCSMPFS